MNTSQASALDEGVGHILPAEGLQVSVSCCHMPTHAEIQNCRKQVPGPADLMLTR